MAKIGATILLSKDEVALVGRKGLESSLVVRPRKGFDGLPDPEPIEQFANGRSGMHLPIDFGLGICEAHGIEIESALCGGVRLKVPKRPDPSHPAAPKGQAKFFADLIEASKNQYTVLAQAPTGSGKTVALLNTVAEFKRSTVVIVPSKTLLYQWRDEAKKHLGLDDSQIGLIGDGHEQLDRPFTICVIHNLFLKIYPQEFYTSFGIAVWDECHNLGAREFSTTMRLFPSTVKLAVSATPDRKDGCEKLFLDYFGPVSVLSEQKPLPLTYTLIKFPLKGIPGSLEYSQSPTKALLWMAENEKRNETIVGLIQKHFARGEVLLVLTKFVEHAETLMRMCRENGRDRILPMQMGMFTGSYTDPSTGTKKIQKQADLDEVARSAKVIFATYGKMKEGVDIPRITMGIEALPVSDVRQAVGRARRKADGKKEARWISIEDTSIRPSSKLSFLYGYTRARCRGLHEVGGVTIVNEG